ncbi:MAG TPA: hypothetical protein ENN09_04245 [Planctomycetes bacterium]|nr:hypothetical protein [Planctomycetota bacterium]
MSGGVFTVRIAGRQWRVQADIRKTRDDLLEWLGPWASASPGGSQPAANISVETARNAGNETARILWNPQGVDAKLENFSLSADWNAAPWKARLLSRPEYAPAALGAALRMLAMKTVIASDGVVLHASSVRFGGGVLVFAGAAGSGKTAAASRFPPEDRLDADTVFISPQGGWTRVDAPDWTAPSRSAPDASPGLRVKAVVFPRPADGFRIERVSRAKAVKMCIHMPPHGLFPDAPFVQKTIDALARLASDLPPALMFWRLSDDIPALLRDFLASPPSVPLQPPSSAITA